MKNRFFPTLCLVALLLAGCAPAASPAAPSAEAPPLQPPASPVVVEASATPAGAPPESSAPTALPVATSRGPDLHATDPATVNLASGQLQFVEFFRFT